MEKRPKVETFLFELDEETVKKLPYYGPSARRIYITVTKNGEKLEKIFVQRKEAFTIDLIESIRRLKNYEITEIKYFCGISGLIRIYLESHGKIKGEYFCKSRRELNDFRAKMEKV